ncbi:MAG: transporter ATPase/permease [Actinomycetia bacterium]|nr:transporter ATPase/permease [Actinomycetes bacterium]
MRDALTGSWEMMATAWRVDWRKTAVSLVLMVAGAAAAPLLAAALGRMTSEAAAGHAAAAVVTGAAVAALAIASLTFSHFAHIAYFELSEMAELDFDEQLVMLSNGSPGIEHQEQPEHADSLTVLGQESRRFNAGLEALLNSLGLGIAMVITAVLLALQSPFLLLLPLAAVPPLLTGRWAERILDRAKTSTAEPTRVALNLFLLSTNARFAGELRVFRLGNEFAVRHARLWGTATHRLWRAHLAATWVRASGHVIFALGYVAAVLLVVRDAIAGQRAIGDVVLVIALAAQVNQQVTTAVTLLIDLQRMSSTYRRLADLRALVAQSARDAVADQEPPARLTSGIEFDGVSFRYPGTDVAVLSDVRLTLPAGSTIAVVGENGAGKTTLIKLLCGFYQPTQGTVRIDGVDLRRVPPDRWRERMAAGFQDFARYELLARQSVGVGDLAADFTDPAVLGALDRARSADIVDRLADGLDTQLGKSHSDGAELSGGQWQKLALGRAMMREGPLLLVLDEPTSALDPEAEHALFERYAEQARRVGAVTGAVTVLVSHRFSTVRMADLIVVIRDGRVAETGSHARLVAAGGLYAELFGIQAAAYR